MRETRDSQRSVLFVLKFVMKNYILDNKFESAILFQSFRELVAACLVKDPKKRPASEKLLKHPFFKQARSNEYLKKTILDGLAPLGDRFRALKVYIQFYLYHNISECGTLKALNILGIGERVQFSSAEPGYL